MISMNKVLLIGKLGKDPETRNTPRGSVTSFSLATSESWKKDGEWQDKTEWHNVVIFNEFLIKAAEKAEKGWTVLIEGQIQYRKWQDQNGNDKYTTEIVLPKFGGVFKVVEKKAGASSGEEVAKPQRQYVPKQPTQAELDDEIPF